MNIKNKSLKLLFVQSIFFIMLAINFTVSKGDNEYPKDTNEDNKQAVSMYGDADDFGISEGVEDGNPLPRFPNFSNDSLFTDAMVFNMSNVLAYCFSCDPENPDDFDELPELTLLGSRLCLRYADLNDSNNHIELNNKRLTVGGISLDDRGISINLPSFAEDMGPIVNTKCIYIPESMLSELDNYVRSNGNTDLIFGLGDEDNIIAIDHLALILDYDEEEFEENYPDPGYEIISSFSTENFDSFYPHGITIDNKGDVDPLNDELYLTDYDYFEDIGKIYHLTRNGDEVIGEPHSIYNTSELCMDGRCLDWPSGITFYPLGNQGGGSLIVVDIWNSRLFEIMWDDVGSQWKVIRYSEASWYLGADDITDLAYKYSSDTLMVTDELFGIFEVSLEEEHFGEELDWMDITDNVTPLGIAFDPVNYDEEIYLITGWGEIEDKEEIRNDGLWLYTTEGSEYDKLDWLTLNLNQISGIEFEQIGNTIFIIDHGYNAVFELRKTD